MLPFRGRLGWEYGSAGDLDRCFGLREEWMRYVCVQAGGADPFQAGRCICELDLDQPYGSGQRLVQERTCTLSGLWVGCIVSAPFLDGICR